MAAISPPFRSAAHRGDLASAAVTPAPFSLLRWFAVVSAATILFVSVSGTLFLSRFVERASLLQSADGLTQIVTSIVEVEKADQFFLRDRQMGPVDFEDLLEHLGTLPDVLRANVYAIDGSILWSSDPSLIGQRFSDNDELETALAGVAVAMTGTIGDSDGKAEHQRLDVPGGRFVENYVPVWSTAPGDRKVIGALEVYLRPTRLLTAIERTQLQIWWGAVGVTALLYVALFAIVARGSRVMRRQHKSLVAAEKLALAGEMASAMAHGLRNPLASIRSTAELGLGSEDADEMREFHAEVVHQADRLEGWIRQFLTAARTEGAARTRADVQAVITECLQDLEPTLARRGIALEVTVPDRLPAARFCPVVLHQVLNSVLANAVEAMPDTGRLAIGASASHRRVSIKVGDTGRGMSAAEIAAALSPFATTKPTGLGLGLPLARDTLERHGGSLRITSVIGAGTVVSVELRAAARGDGRR